MTCTPATELYNHVSDSTYWYLIFAVEISFKEAACAVIADIGLDIIVVPCLVLVIVFWALFGAFVGHPDRESYIYSSNLFPDTLIN